MTRLVLLPGLHGTGELFDGFMRCMPEPKHLEALYFPKDAILPYETLVKGIQSFVPDCEPYYLLAESFSTPLAIMFAATRPQNLRGLILCAGFASSPLKGWKRSLIRPFVPLFFKLGIPKIAFTRLIGAEPAPDLENAVQDAISVAEPAVLADRAMSVLACDVTAELGNLTAPILYLQARQDRVVPAKCLDEIRQIRPDTLVEVIDAPHLLLQREPQKGAEAVSRFIRAVESRRFAPEN